ncbi:MAG: divalent metal cation transporter, partial [Verrucomicrobia bacterium]|nr:divalent metal cation transporter [Deltaproteobacteria bacterium]
LILIPNAPLMAIMFISQVVNGAVLPFVLIFMIKLINDKNLMGSYTNKPAFNLIAWTTVVTMVALTVVMTVDIAFPGIIKRLLSF